MPKQSGGTNSTIHKMISKKKEKCQIGLRRMIMKTASELDEKELRQAYVFACRRYNEAYKQKKELEEEMYKRFERDLEENRI
jgi:hypothetical protein